MAVEIAALVGPAAIKAGLPVLLNATLKYCTTYNDTRRKDTVMQLQNILGNPNPQLLQDMKKFVGEQFRQEHEFRKQSSLKEAFAKRYEDIRLGLQVLEDRFEAFVAASTVELSRAEWDEFDAVSKTYLPDMYVAWLLEWITEEPRYGQGVVIIDVSFMNNLK